MNQESLGNIGQYALLRCLGRGGMGEVFLAYDASCKREVALKRIRSDLKNNQTIRTRFLSEALIAAKLSHPSIIPIHTIDQEEDGTPFYTMPYIEGETLRAILHKSRLEEKTGHIAHPIGSSIPMLVRIFLNACQAIAYCHNRGILHRDLKPENILVGKFGETMIVDWGLAQYIEDVGAEEFDEQVQEDESLTRPGKVVGTLAYIAPERALHQPASILSDLYSLGVILYQILALRVPFQRRDIKSFRRVMHREQLITPLEADPYRDIPRELSEIACKCLAFDKSQRFSSVSLLIANIEQYLEGFPEWMPVASLRIDKKTDWEFQEHVLLAKHQALSEIPEEMEWVSMMLSKSAFWGNLKIEAQCTLVDKSAGVEVLFGVPDGNLHKRPIEGWGLKLGSAQRLGCTLFRNQIEVQSRPDIFLETGRLYHLRIEVVQAKICAFLDDIQLFDYINPLPIIGNHIGIISRDEGSILHQLNVFVGSHNALVNCLAIPDAFLAKGYDLDALEEYRRIAYCFRGRTEGREALFRAGVTLVDLAKKRESDIERTTLLEEALEQFSTLSGGPAAPLEYLGKSLVYKESQDLLEENKCLELALRKAHQHPLRSTVAAQVLFRLHEAAYYSRFETYAIALLALQQIPDLLEASAHQDFFISLYRHLEPLPLFCKLPQQEERQDLTIQLAFWLAKPYILEGFKTDYPSAVFALEALRPPTEGLGALWQLAQTSSPNPLSMWLLMKATIDETLLNPEQPWLTSLPSQISFGSILHAEIDSLWSQLYLAKKAFSQAEQIFQCYEKKDLEQEKHPLFVPYGCWLRYAKGEASALHHFSDISTTIYPPISALLAHVLLGRSENKITPFLWQKVELARQRALYYRCSENDKKAVSEIQQLRKELHQCLNP
ncbi:MAG: protein kinase [Simkania sp.]|nr:protein kinase [Simkania sp.]